MNRRDIDQTRPRAVVTSHDERFPSRRQGLATLIVALVSLGGLLVLPLHQSTSAAPIDAASVNNPPVGTHSIIVFPQRDFVSADGYADGDLVVVHVIEPDGTVISTDPATPIAPVNGLVEVNHPGGSCWFGQTPDIRPGDKVQIDIVGGPNANTADATTVRNITAKRPVQTAADTVVVHGTARDNFDAAPGAPLDIALLEHRIVAPGNLFQVNNRRTMRATSLPGSEGTLAYDPIDPITNPTGTNWTATYSGLSPEDVALALGAESRGMWLGNAVAPALETTVYEIGALTVGGPAAPCTAPLQVRAAPPGSETVPPTDPTDLVGTFDGVNQVTLTWTASTDNVGVTAYGIYRNGQAVFTVSNADGSAPAPTTYVEKNLPPGTYSFEVRAFDEVGNASGLSNVTDLFTAVQRVDINNFPINDPPSLPINIIVFPSRDFISPSGFLDSDVVSVQLLRKNSAGNLVVVSSADGIIPTDGFAEVNHPGGACWAGVTPDIRVGDIVRTIAYNPANVTLANVEGIRSIDQTTVSGVTAKPPVVTHAPTVADNDGIVEIHGTALGADGQPLPLDQIEQRMIATHGVGLWDFNGRRAMRAGANADGTLTYDTLNNPMGINWTATYSGLDAADVARMADADTRAHWLGRSPLLLNEATIFENAPGTNPPGPAGPGCTRPIETPDSAAPSTPGNLVVDQTGADQVTLSWMASTDDWSVAGYRVSMDGVAVANTTENATSHVLQHVAPGAHTYAVSAFDHASPLGAGANFVAQIAAGFGNLYGNLSVPATVGPLTQADVTAPSVPTNLVAQSGVGQVTLNWTASTDDVGVVEYGIYRDGNQIATVPAGTTTYLDTPLGIGTYSYTVDAADAGLRSAQSSAATATVTSIPDIIPPTIPTNVVATTSPDIHGRNVVVSWNASTDEVDGSGVGGYEVHRQRIPLGNGPDELIATVNAATLSYTDASLASASYRYTVKAFDSAGNHSDASANSDAVVANDPPIGPHSLIAFPARDFISATGYTPDTLYHFTVIRGGVTFDSGSWAADATGLVEVNHPGGTCWLVNTPDIRPNDVVRITDDTTGVADQTTVANVTAERPIAVGASTVIIHGTADDGTGNPIPVAQVEQRLITGTASSFDFNGRRLLRTGVDGTLTYDAPGSIHWTATYTGLSANDVLRAVGGTSPNGTVFPGAESRAHWLGRVPLALTESTIFENGPAVLGGPAGPGCTAPAEGNRPAVSLNPTSVGFGLTEFIPNLSNRTSTVTIANGGIGTMTVTNVYFAGLNTGDFTRTAAGTCPAGTFTLTTGKTCTVVVKFIPGGLGLRQGYLAFSDDAANTTDQAVALTGTGVDNNNPTISVVPPTNFGTVAGGQASTRTVTVKNVGVDANGRVLTVGASSIGGANAADFKVIGTTCTVDLPQGQVPSASCALTVEFRPGARTARTATLTINHNAAPLATSTTVALAGTGGNGAVLSFASNPVTFGTVGRTATKDQTISVKNSGNQAATVTLASFTVTGTGYSVRSTTCATVAANGSCSVVVRFTGNNTVGNFPGTLSVTVANGLPTKVTTNLSASTK